jgi:RNA polymerase sigma-70 factor, ECF subfamily
MFRKPQRLSEPRKHVQREVSDDRGLVAQAKSGCSSAFGQLCERHRLRVYRTTLRVLRQRQDAEDAVQRCFQRAFTNLTKFRGDATFATWMTRIAINEALMLLRQRRGDKSLSDIDNGDREAASKLTISCVQGSLEQHKTAYSRVDGAHQRRFGK